MFFTATAFVGALQCSDSELRFANLGDSGLLVLRRSATGQYTLILRTVEQQHYFNCPFQLSSAQTKRSFPDSLSDSPLAASIGSIKLQNNGMPWGVAFFNILDQLNCYIYYRMFHLTDILIAATDGVLDNLFDDHMVQMANKEYALFKL